VGGREGGGVGMFFLVFSAIRGKAGDYGSFPALVCFGFFLIKKKIVGSGIWTYVVG
jgi:hypothetical protein